MVKSNRLKSHFFKIGISYKNIRKSLGVLILGLVMTGLAAIYTRHNVEVQVRKEFAAVCNDISNKISTRLHAHAQLLRSGAAFFSVSDTVTRKDWKVFTENLNYQENLPGIQGIGFTLDIPNKKLKQHIQNIREEGFPDYSVKPSGNRAVYTPIIYLEPFSGRNLRAFGYDTYSEPVRRKAMELSRDKNLAILTGKVKLVQETTDDLQTGTLMFTPVYRNNMPINTVEQRRAAIVGWVYSPYRMNDLMEGILGRWDLAQKERIRLQIFDDSLSVSSLLYDSQKNDSPNLIKITCSSITLPVKFNGKKWVLLFTQSNQQNSYFQGKVILVLVSGILISLLLFLLLVSLFNTRFRALQIAQRLTLELRLTEERLREVLENSLDASYKRILKTQKYEYLSPVFKKICGYAPAELENLPVETVLDLIHPDDVQKVNRVITHSIYDNAETTYQLEYRFKHKNGQYRWFKDSFTVVRDLSGQPVALIGSVSDITLSVEAKEALHYEQSLLRAVVDNIPDTIYCMDTACRKTLANLTDLRYMGVKTEAEVLGKDDFAFYPRETAEHFMAVNRMVIQTGNPVVNHEEYLIDENGDSRCLLSTKIPMRNNEGQIIGLLGIGRDITDRKKGEVALKESEMRFHNIADIAPVMIWESDKDGLFYYFNKPWLDFTGRTLDQEIGKGWTEDLHPDDHLNYLDIYSNAFKERRKFRMEYRIRSYNGEYRWVIDHGVPRFDHEGNLLGYIGSCVDITDRKLIETANETLSLRNQTLLQTASDGIHVLDDQGYVIEANLAFCNMLGYSHDELLKLNVADWDKDMCREDLVAKIHTLITHSAVFETRHCRKDGTFRAIEINSVGVKLEGRDYLYASARDITDRKLSELQIREKNEELIKLNAQKDRFFSIIAHDLRSPFNGFLGLTQIMVEELPTLTLDELQQIGVSLKNSAFNLFRLLENLLEWSKLQQGLIPYNPKVLRLLPVIVDSLTISIESAKRKEIEIIYNISDKIMVMADLHILQTVIRNLVANGIKFTKKGGIITLLATVMNDDSVEIAITDTGIGMSRNLIDNLFRLDINTSRKGTDNESSTGLGLIICNDFVQRLGGKLKVESIVGKGSTFRFNLPLIPKDF